MTPTLIGRLHTRAVLLALIGLPWSLLLVVVARISFQGALVGWAVLTGLALIIWEPLYHLLQQLRWEKDWPICFSLVTVINEAALTWAVVSHLLPARIGPFLLQVLTTWIILWLLAIGPLRVVSLRWRYRGGRLW